MARGRRGRRGAAGAGLLALALALALARAAAAQALAPAGPGGQACASLKRKACKKSPAYQWGGRPGSARVSVVTSTR